MTLLLPPERNPASNITEAVETYGFGGAAPLILSCEHASNRIPPPLEASANDEIWLNTHWGIDIGTAELTRAIVEMTGSMAVLARFSRLVCDANRHRDRDDLIRAQVEGCELDFNRGVDEAEVTRRIETYHEPFHQVLDQVIGDRMQIDGPVMFISMHSFTPIWDRKMRTMDVGVLYNPYEELALQVQKELDAEGFFTAMNEPYSAAFGLMYSAERHGRKHHVQHIELEFNQALLCTPQRARRVAKKVVRALSRLPIWEQAS